MIATNHAVTGAVVGLTVSNPLLAIPAALASHFVCDIIPHYGSKISLAGVGFKLYLVADAAMCVALVVWLFLLGNPNWLLASVCAFVATSPDLIWIRKFVLANKNKAFRASLVEKFLDKIQWFQRPIGAAVEAAWLVAGLAVLATLL